MGHSSDSELTSPYGRAFWIAVAIGGAVTTFGVGGLIVESSRTHPDQWVRWFVGTVLVHDFVIAPIVFMLGVMIAKRVRPRLRAMVQGSLIATAMVTFVAYPLVRGYGVSDDNPSALPDNYTRNLALVVGAIWLPLVAREFFLWLRRGVK